MNVRKVALFVEGLAEQVFVRDFLVKWYGWDINKVGIDCYMLHAGNEHYAPYSHGSVDSENYYQIFNVGNDNSVLSVMLDRADRLHNAGYSLVIGLKDMFNKVYHQKTFQKNNGRIIDPELNERFIQSAKDTIEISSKPLELQMHFAIMEVEAWLLGMPKLMEHLQDVSDPETDIYHPAVKLKELMEDLGSGYDKHSKDIETIIGDLEKEDYLALYESGRCQSFRNFVDSLVDVKEN
ncbi:MAG: hypothetical protein II989_05060 [Bacteroidales bacterium]|nr:hypothetical protein [Bacteroidales bacterium]